MELTFHQRDTDNCKLTKLIRKIYIFKVINSVKKNRTGWGGRACVKWEGAGCNFSYDRIKEDHHWPH